MQAGTRAPSAHALPATHPCASIRNTRWSRMTARCITRSVLLSLAFCAAPVAVGGRAWPCRRHKRGTTASGAPLGARGTTGISPKTKPRAPTVVVRPYPIRRMRKKCTCRRTTRAKSARSSGATKRARKPSSNSSCARWCAPHEPVYRPGWRRWSSRSAAVYAGTLMRHGRSGARSVANQWPGIMASRGPKRWQGAGAQGGSRSSISDG